jgi:hypothetical protein
MCRKNIQTLVHVDLVTEKIIDFRPFSEDFLGDRNDISEDAAPRFHRMGEQPKREEQEINKTEMRRNRRDVGDCKRRLHKGKVSEHELQDANNVYPPSSNQAGEMPADYCHCLLRAQRSYPIREFSHHFFKRGVLDCRGKSKICCMIEAWNVDDASTQPLFAA